MGEKKFHVRHVPSVGDAIGLYGFICPILKMLPYDVYLRVEIGGSGLVLETEKHYFDDMYALSRETGGQQLEETDADYIASLSGSRGYPIDYGSLYKSRKQLHDAGFYRKRAATAFMSRYSKSTILKNSFDSDIKWGADAKGRMILVMTSSSEGDFKRLERRLLQQFDLEEIDASLPTTGA